MSIEFTYKTIGEKHSTANDGGKDSALYKFIHERHHATRG